ncbi:CCE_0567 family metalloprotein [Rhizobium laguerreae]|uniref:CCE_0567 family metalloprotein n=1 Tax=Rhizobium laguerreae TaxID=1076926 RepID=UPI003703C12C
MALEMETMVKLEELKKRVRKLTSHAGIVKMELRDLTEDLPRGWSEIASVAEKAARAFAALHAAKRELAATENAKWEARFRKI